ncbi:hypothetical protein [Sandarakinorhabdus sp.]|uniref:hypothetical protein n=1 Tax=Sandarakinorhabdus sp. TaxID=1916663 RepID=UPI0028A72725|nr:hypothetical protein [Sandarakinorhabdus sp.]
MAQPPWKDALARARRADAGGPEPAAPLRPAEAARHMAVPPVEQLAAQAPGLKQLLAERQALEQQMQGLTGGNPADPRYAVEPLDRRRAALAAWSQSRDAARGARRDPAAAFAPQAPPLRATAADPLRGTSADQLRGTNADVLRATPGELPGDARPSRLFEAFERPPAAPAANDDPPLRALGRALAPPAQPESRRARRAARDDGPPLGEAGRQLGAAGRRLEDAGRNLGDPGRSLDAPRRAAPPEPERPRGNSGDPLDRRLARARDMAARARRTLDNSERALDQARDAIPGNWQERARERIPGLGKADHYVREAARKLSTLAGAVDDVGSKADRLRGLARDMRELKEADAANDEARRERALDRLKARRQEG